MSKIPVCLAFLIELVALSSCDRFRLNRDISRIMESTVALPAKVSVSIGGEVYPMEDSLRAVPKMVVYIDSTECSMCRVSKFYLYEPIYRLSRETGAFELMLLMYPTKIEGITISRIIADMEMAIPVYVDDNDTFLSDNQFIPKDSRLHSFFVDETGRPVFVGDPALNADVDAILKKYLNKTIQR